MKIGFLDFATLGPGIDLAPFKQLGEVFCWDTSTREECFERVRDLDVLVTNKVAIDASLMDQAANLRLINVSATGTNHIDLEAARSRGISVRNVAAYSTHSVAQHTFALLFGLLGAIPYYDRYTKSGDWTLSSVFTHIAAPFWEVRNKCWGIIGMGAIGQEVARLATAFGAQVIYFSTSGKNEQATYRRVSLEELLTTADIVSIHAPLNEDTRGLLQLEQLELLRPGAVLLNLGRGGIIDENSLAKILDEKELLVGLDVLEAEPMRPEHPLLSIKYPQRLLVTPHMAWTSREARATLVHALEQHIQEL